MLDYGHTGSTSSWQQTLLSVTFWKRLLTRLSVVAVDERSPRDISQEQNATVANLIGWKNHTHVSNVSHAKHEARRAQHSCAVYRETHVRSMNNSAMTLQHAARETFIEGAPYSPTNDVVHELLTMLGVNNKTNPSTERSRGNRLCHSKNHSTHHHLVC